MNRHFAWLAAGLLGLLALGLVLLPEATGVDPERVRPFALGFGGLGGAILVFGGLWGSRKQALRFQAVALVWLFPLMALLFSGLTWGTYQEAGQSFDVPEWGFVIIGILGAIWWARDAAHEIQIVEREYPEMKFYLILSAVLGGIPIVPDGYRPRETRLTAKLLIIIGAVVAWTGVSLFLWGSNEHEGGRLWGAGGLVVTGAVLILWTFRRARQRGFWMFGRSSWE